MSILAAGGEATALELARQHLITLGYRCDIVGSLARARKALERARYDVVLVDVRLRDGPGLELLESILGGCPDTTVIMLCTVEDIGLALECFRGGAYGYVLKPLDLDDLSVQVGAALRQRALEKANRAYQTQLHDIVQRHTVDLVAALREAEENRDLTVEALCTAVQARLYKDPEQGQRVARVAVTLARELQLSDKELMAFEIGAHLRDIGMLGISDRTLLKPGPLNNEEWEEVKQHPGTGYDMVSVVEPLEGAAKVVLCHHERYDGSGYPQRLAGVQIPVGARVVAVADSLDAMLRQRPFSEARGFLAAKDDIEHVAGRQLDPEVVAHFLRIADDLRQSVYPHAAP